MSAKAPLSRWFRAKLPAIVLVAAPCIAPGLLLIPRQREPVSTKRIDEVLRLLEQTFPREIDRVPVIVFPEPQGCPILVKPDPKENRFAP